jgi:hypothetical protein
MVDELFPASFHFPTEIMAIRFSPVPPFGSLVFQFVQVTGSPLIYSKVPSTSTSALMEFAQLSDSVQVVELADGRKLMDRRQD